MPNGEVGGAHTEQGRRLRTAAKVILRHPFPPRQPEAPSHRVTREPCALTGCRQLHFSTGETGVLEYTKREIKYFRRLNVLCQQQKTCPCYRNCGPLHKIRQKWKEKETHSSMCYKLVIKKKKRFWTKPYSYSSVTNPRPLDILLIDDGSNDKSSEKNQGSPLICLLLPNYEDGSFE